MSCTCKFENDGYNTLRGERCDYCKAIELENESKMKAEIEKHEALAYLRETDYLILKHIEESTLGIEKSLKDDEYIGIINNRQEARSKLK